MKKICEDPNCVLCTYKCSACGVRFPDGEEHLCKDGKLIKHTNGVGTHITASGVGARTTTFFAVECATETTSAVIDCAVVSTPPTFTQAVYTATNPVWIQNLGNADAD